jgi:hypothetical protein
MDKVEIIRLAIYELGINFDEATFLTTPIYEIAERLFDFSLKDSISNIRLNVTERIVPLVQDMSSNIEYDGLTFVPFKLPEDLVWFQQFRPEYPYNIVRDIIYIATPNIDEFGTTTEEIKLVYSSTIDFIDISETIKNYFVLSLAVKLCKPLHKNSQIGELMEKQMMALNKIQNAQNFGNGRNKIWELEDEDDFGIY